MKENLERSMKPDGMFIIKIEYKTGSFIFHRKFLLTRQGRTRTVLIYRLLTNVSQIVSYSLWWSPDITHRRYRRSELIELPRAIRPNVFWLFLKAVTPLMTVRFQSSVRAPAIRVKTTERASPTWWRTTIRASAAATTLEQTAKQVQPHMTQKRS